MEGIRAHQAMTDYHIQQSSVSSAA
uniref:Uncharacterized protein n=1 Tax=Arundo donax TaxID=35708 RepID=A0A0A9CFP7_ARUDO